MFQQKPQIREFYTRNQLTFCDRSWKFEQLVKLIFASLSHAIPHFIVKQIKICNAIKRTFQRKENFIHIQLGRVESIVSYVCIRNLINSLCCGFGIFIWSQVFMRKGDLEQLWTLEEWVGG